MLNDGRTCQKRTNICESGESVRPRRQLGIIKEAILALGRRAASLLVTGFAEAVAPDVCNDLQMDGQAPAVGEN